MQKTVTLSLTWSTDSETDGHADYSCVVLWGVSRKLTIRGRVSISHAPSSLCLIDTHIIFSSNCCMLTLYCLIGHSIVISQPPTMRDTGTSNWQAPSLTYYFWNRNLRRIVPPRRLKVNFICSVCLCIICVN